ncbi:serine hydrolase [Synechococcus sp. Tobar12-5m-g]|uniref:serine hydrolase n=1 Tax=unclassified Synechococcus TaxID=2626047 RepID=UPI0020CF8F54|nr:MULTISPECIES: serine hydrolase [unclassified Synechococcus]MCP9773042.1 serine hydrolase [Synechococcus sp. Tobar12-5m-g]MCP9873809.1 serine hydrolase [Synechococcus sp. Cruz CV-v-12]
MAFYRPDGVMGAILEDRIRSLEREGRPGLSGQISVCWLRYDRSLIGRADALSDPAAFWAEPMAGAGWRGDQPAYPASVVKLFLLAGVEAWLQRCLLEDSAELRRAMADMIRDSSNDATSLLVDMLSGTTSGPDLPEAQLRAWIAQRQLLNQWLAGLGWPELKGCNVCQKTWGDGPYGRERQFYGPALENRNRLSAEATARLLHAIVAGSCISPPACSRMRQLLRRSLERADRSADPENQVDGFLGEGLPEGARLWSKAGWMSQARHDAAYVEIDGYLPFLLVVFSEGRERAGDGKLLPALARDLSEACRREASLDG